MTASDLSTVPFRGLASHQLKAMLRRRAVVLTYHRVLPPDADSCSTAGIAVCYGALRACSGFGSERLASNGPRITDPALPAAYRGRASIYWALLLAHLHEASLHYRGEGAMPSERISPRLSKATRIEVRTSARTVLHNKLREWL